VPKQGTQRLQKPCSWHRLSTQQDPARYREQSSTRQAQHCFPHPGSRAGNPPRHPSPHHQATASSTTETMPHGQTTESRRTLRHKARVLSLLCSSTRTALWGSSHLALRSGEIFSLLGWLFRTSTVFYSKFLRMEKWLWQQSKFAYVKQHL